MSKRRDKRRRRHVKARNRTYVAWWQMWLVGWIKLLDALIWILTFATYPSDLAGTYLLTVQLKLHEANFAPRKRHAAGRRSRTSH